MRLDDAIELQNARQREKNKKEGKPENYNNLTQSNLGRKTIHTLKNKSPVTRMSALAKEIREGKVKTVRPEWIILWVKETGTDFNFIFGAKSIHDKDFERLS